MTVTTIARTALPAATRRAKRLARWGAAALVVAVLAACSGADEPDDDVATEGADEPSAGLTEGVSIPAEGIELSGTLWLPGPEEEAGGEATDPAPVVVIAHGSGPLSRDGVLGGQLGLTLPQPVLAYRELAENLQARGYAVFTWDKRTCGPFNGCAENDYPTPSDDLTFGTLQDDVGAVLDALGARADIGEIVLVGHSKGGVIAAGLADERDDLAGVVLLATPVAPVHEVLQAQAEKFAELVAATGQQGPAAEGAIAELREVAEQVGQIAEGDIDGPDVGGASPEFWASYIDASLAAPGHLASAGIPVLALGGAYDWNVPEAQVDAWEQYLGEEGRVQILPNITHALTYLGTEEVAEITAEDVGVHVDPSVIDALVAWLAQALDR